MNQSKSRDSVCSAHFQRGNQKIWRNKTMKKINLKQISKKLFAFLTIIAATTFVAVAQDNNSKTENTIAASRCGENTLRGGYGTHISGTFLTSPTTSVPLVSVGRLVFDGTGNFSGSDTNSFGGTVS